jgi:membrane protease YdiL (CAAX protease family)
MVFFLIGTGTINGLNEWFRVLIYSLLVSQVKIFLSFGIFLTRLQTLTSQRASVIGAAILFALPFSALGYSLISFLLIGITGLGYGWLVITFKSLLPVYILHSVLVFLYILIGGFPALTH